MRFMLFICPDPGLQLAPEDEAAIPAQVETWANDLADRGIRLMGHVFEPAEQAKTIRRSEEEVQIKDGPVTTVDQPIAGFNLLECDTLEQAVEVSSRHPMARHGALELRAIAA